MRQGFRQDDMRTYCQGGLLAYREVKSQVRYQTRGARGLQGCRNYLGFRWCSLVTIPGGPIVTDSMALRVWHIQRMCSHADMCDFRRRVSAGSRFRPRSLSVFNVEVEMDPRTQKTMTATSGTVCP
jgi:hypothetical protein